MPQPLEHSLVPSRATAAQVHVQAQSGELTPRSEASLFTTWSLSAARELGPHTLAFACDG